MAATKPKPKTETTALTLARLNRQLRDQATADWRRWAADIATGGSPPDMREMLAAAQALGIDDPAAALHDDSEAIAEVRRATENLKLCQRTTDELLEPWGGSLAKLEAAVAAAKREVERLTEILGRAADGCSRSYWVDTAHHARLKHPRIWPSYAATGKAEEV